MWSTQLPGLSPSSWAASRSAGSSRSRRSRRRATTSVAAAGLALGAAACGSGGSSGSSTPGAVHATITVAAVGSIDGTSFFSALQQGFFAQHGLNVNIKVQATGVEVMNQINSGAAQFGDVGADPNLAAIAKGLPLRIIADNHGSAVQSYYAENQAIVAGPHSGLSAGDIAGLKGKTVGVALGTDAVGYMQTLLQQAGLALSDVTMINVSPADGISALARGSVDAIATFEPWPSVALQQVPGSTLVIEDHSQTWYDPGVIVSSLPYLSANPAVATAFLAAVAQSEQWVRGHLTQAAANATQSITGLQAAVADRAIQHVTFDMRLSKLVLQGIQQEMIPFLKSSHQIAGDLNVTDAVDSTDMVSVQKTYPQYFSDLPPIPAADQLT